MAVATDSMQGSVRLLYGSMCRSLEQPAVVVQPQPEPANLLLLPAPPRPSEYGPGPLGSDGHEKVVVEMQEITLLAEKNGIDAPDTNEYSELVPLLPQIVEVLPPVSPLVLASQLDNQEAVAMDESLMEQSARNLLFRQLCTALRHNVFITKRGKDSMEIFRQMRDEGFEIHHGIVKTLYFLIVPRRPYEAYEVLQYYRTLPATFEYAATSGDINGYASFYGRLCDSLRYIGYRSKQEGFVIAESVAKELQGLDRNGRRLCFPNFVSAMVEQPWVNVGSYFAGPFYEAIIEQNLTVNPKWWYHILTHSKHNRQEDVSFGDVAHRLVMQYGIRPVPNVILHALENIYPFNDLDSVEAFLQSILHLQQESNILITENHPDIYRYDLDIAILESITAVAANQGDPDVCVLVLNLLESYEIDSNESIYENAACAFASSPFTYNQAFAILSEMEQNGFTPRLSLIRTISTHLRYASSLSLGRSAVHSNNDSLAGYELVTWILQMNK
jgi:hypothetical protein